ncbi:hypothetical protein KI387_034314 [Taxus chinensis]|uniref:Pre-SET domain-containing protein n=1 Tax=Taxus chinensis TaxID=29808 RepID=A0AA38C4V3_TAXCH|nr:hypothetical protein KI387_034314 [Taxus chinensis]
MARNHGLEIYRIELAKLGNKAFKKDISIENIKSDFRRTWLWSLNREALINDMTPSQAFEVGDEDERSAIENIMRLVEYTQNEIDPILHSINQVTHVTQTQEITDVGEEMVQGIHVLGEGLSLPLQTIFVVTTYTPKPTTMARTKKQFKQSEEINWAPVVFPWLSPQSIASLARTCSSFRSLSKTITTHRIADAARGLEKYPVPVSNPVDNILYPYFLYTPTSIFSISSPKQQWGHETSADPQQTKSLISDSEILEGTGCNCTDCSKEEQACSCNELRVYSDDGRIRFSGGCLNPNFEDNAEFGGLNPRFGGLEDNAEIESLDGGPMVVMECGPACRCGEGCRNRVSQRGLSVRVEIVRHLKKGWGLHVAEPVKRGAFVCEYAGEFLTTAEARERQWHYDEASLNKHNFCSALLVIREHLPSGQACLRLNIDATILGFVKVEASKDEELVEDICSLLKMTCTCRLGLVLKKKEEYIRWSRERESDWLPVVLDALSQAEQDTLQRAGILRIARVPHVAPASHILCDLFSYWDADQNTFRFPGVRGEWTITLEDVYRILGVPIIGRRLSFDTTVSRAQVTQWATYMGDAVVSTGLKKGVKVHSIPGLPIPLICQAIMGILASRLIRDKGGDTLLYCWAPIIAQIEAHGQIYAWGADILGTTYHDLYRVVRLQG